MNSSPRVESTRYYLAPHRSPSLNLRRADLAASAGLFAFCPHHPLPRAPNNRFALAHIASLPAALCWAHLWAPVATISPRHHPHNSRLRHASRSASISNHETGALVCRPCRPGIAFHDMPSSRIAILQLYVGPTWRATACPFCPHSAPTTLERAIGAADLGCPLHHVDAKRLRVGAPHRAHDKKERAATSGPLPYACRHLVRLLILRHLGPRIPLSGTVRLTPACPR
jgi:hypothetical protein